MKKIFLMLFLLVVLSSCQEVANILGVSLDPSLTYPDGSMGRASFYADYKEQGNKRYNFNKIAEYDKLIIYLQDGAGYKPESVDYIAKVFNDNYAEEVRIYGEHTDVDKNGKIIILLLELNASYSGGVITGYFYGADLILNQNNNAEILYMDIKMLNDNPQYMAGTIQHEFQHLINFNVNYIRNGRQMSTWLNEALYYSAQLQLIQE
ncbi:hypothetical protein [uncultured Brachyspira sp.]|uniref:lipoprotein n=1 Tax=uncultured Brachyspira sp. TaxID=221953 RepID=UPI00345BA2F7